MRWLVIMLVACSAPAPKPIASAAPKVAPPAPEGVDVRDSSGWTALQRAAEAGDLAQLTALLARGASLEASSANVYSGATALLIALQFSEPEAAKLLLDRGASIAGKLGTDALFLAARDGEDAIVDELIARHVAVQGMNVLSGAAKYGRVTTIARLIKAGASVNEVDTGDHRFTPLMVAVMEGQLEAARALVAAGANVNAVDEDGVTVLHWAVFGERPIETHIYRDLSKPHDTIWTPRTDAPIVKLLITHGANVNAIDGDANTPLHQAALMDASAAAAELLAAGSKRAARNRDHQTAYDLAKARHNSVERVLAP